MISSICPLSHPAIQKLANVPLLQHPWGGPQYRAVPLGSRRVKHYSASSTASLEISDALLLPTQVRVPRVQLLVIPNEPHRGIALLLPQCHARLELSKPQRWRHLGKAGESRS